MSGALIHYKIKGVGVVEEDMNNFKSIKTQRQSIHKVLEKILPVSQLVRQCGD